MKTNRMYWLAILALLVGVAFLGRVTAQSTAPAGPARAAVCNIDQVLMNYQRAKDLNAQLDKEMTGRTNEDTAREKAIEAARMEEEALAEGSPAREAKLAEYEKLVLDRKSWREYESAKVLRQQQVMAEKMYREILQAVQAEAQAKGYQLVLYRDDIELKSESRAELFSKIALRKVLYNDPALDITDDVLRRMNDQYKAKGK